MTAYLVAGAALGLSAGVSPGPLTTLIIAESLRGGWPAGFRVALAPLITDSLLVTLALLIIALLPAWGLAWIGVIGGLIPVWMGCGTVRVAWAPGAAPTAGPPSFLIPFFTMLVGCKVLMALGVATGRRFLQTAGYRWVLAASGAILAALGVWRAWMGALQLLG